jgi:alkylhydroperoxidase family enzyme
VSFGRRTGLSDSQIRGIAEPNAALFNPQEMAVLTYAGELTSESRVSDATFGAVAEFFNDEEIVELTMVTGFYNMVSRTLNALQVDVDAPAAKDLAEVGVSL